MAIKAILWDLDGVIADTGEAHFRAWSKFAERYHITYSREIFNNTFGMDNHSILKRLFANTSQDLIFYELAQEKEKIFQVSMKKNIHLFPCARDLMELFRSEGLLQIIASSAPAQNIHRIVNLLGINNLIPDFISGDDLLGKPDPAIFNLAAKSLGIANKACFVIEDSPLGIQAAHAARMYCVGIASTFNSKKLSAADDVVKSLCSLKEKIQQRGLNNYFSDLSLITKKQ